MGRGRLWDLFSSFFVISLVTVGGGAAMIPLVVDFAVERKKWLSEEGMVDCLAVCQSLPGAIIINIATYIGKKTGGLAGALAAALGSVAPAFATIMLVMLFIDRLGGNSHLAGALDGAKAAAAALVLVACLRIGRAAFAGARDTAIAVGSFVAVGILGVPAAAAIGAGALAGLISGALGRRAASTKGKGGPP